MYRVGKFIDSTFFSYFSRSVFQQQEKMKNKFYRNDKMPEMECFLVDT